jgi:UDP-N-acetylmuramoyl-tripeptide--D-alanyl-D-alanine ligase
VKKYFSLLLLNYFRLLAKIQLAKNKKMIIVGITGSAGKSSTLNACETVLSPKYKVKTNGGSNSESGIPLSILGIKVTSYSPLDWLKYALLAPIMLIANWQKYDFFLCEMGIDEPTTPKNMSYLLKILTPDIGIFLNVNLVHSEQFDKTVPKSVTGEARTAQVLQNIGREKAKMIASLPSNGYALLNINDPIVSSSTLNTLAKKIALKPTHIEFQNYAPPAGFDISVSAAINLAKLNGIDEKVSIENLKNNLIFPPSRSTLLKGIKDTIIIDSSYNSSPLACSEMLNVLKKYPSPRVAILGDMREMGMQSVSAHQQIYRQALKCADTIISVGPMTKRFFGDKAIKFTYWWEADKYIKSHLLPKSTILIKGSQNTIYLEEIVKSLSLSDEPICRQSPHWKSVKDKFKAANS